MKIGIIKEGKTPVDFRVPFTPDQCQSLKNLGFEIIIQPSKLRCYTDEEYLLAGCTLNEDVQECDIIFGVKEVPISELIANKTYFFFSHTIKSQPYNWKLLRACIDKNIRLIDYEPLTQDNGARVVAFGEFAGMVGAHNGLLTYGQKTDEYSLKPAHLCADYAEMIEQYKSIQFPSIKIVVTGSGRVAQGAMKTLDAAGIRKVGTTDFLSKKYTEAVYTEASIFDYVKTKNEEAFKAVELFTKPELFDNNFSRFAKVSDLFINAIFWDPKAPVLLTKKEMAAEDFQIKVIADITCDIEGSIPSTVRPSTIDNPVYGFDIKNWKEVSAFTKEGIDVMAVDNLPNELPRDASLSFGQQLLDNIVPELKFANSEILKRATICENGALSGLYLYLTEYSNGNLSLTN
jgi:saccharopine dehydrogenase (NAD+, L-lysine-forming)